MKMPNNFGTDECHFECNFHSPSRRNIYICTSGSHQAIPEYCTPIFTYYYYYFFTPYDITVPNILMSSNAPIQIRTSIHNGLGSYCC